eukprot:TRINITY_DN10507_c1_g1_i1.p1 TRINITY_DN10507_c1_g1~~TRINITY_DN10507_c1_g1_i1.p1  ORF type:complete len:1164 (+),score=72.35 TRINITY_DN10507_c1_g1_i1:140-3631(+)
MSPKTRPRQVGRQQTATKATKTVVEVLDINEYQHAAGNPPPFTIMEEFEPRGNAKDLSLYQPKSNLKVVVCNIGELTTREMSTRRVEAVCVVAVELLSKLEYTNLHIRNVIYILGMENPAKDAPEKKWRYLSRAQLGYFLDRYGALVAETYPPREVKRRITYNEYLQMNPGPEGFWNQSPQIFGLLPCGTQSEAEVVLPEVRMRDGADLPRLRMSTTSKALKAPSVLLCVPKKVMKEMTGVYEYAQGHKGAYALPTGGEWADWSQRERVSFVQHYVVAGEHVWPWDVPVEDRVGLATLPIPPALGVEVPDEAHQPMPHSLTTPTPTDDEGKPPQPKKHRRKKKAPAKPSEAPESSPPTPRPSETPAAMPTRPAMQGGPPLGMKKESHALGSVDVGQKVQPKKPAHPPAPPLPSVHPIPPMASPAPTIPKSSVGESKRIPSDTGTCEGTEADMRGPDYATSIGSGGTGTIVFSGAQRDHTDMSQTVGERVEGTAEHGVVSDQDEGVEEEETEAMEDEEESEGGEEEGEARDDWKVGDHLTLRWEPELPPEYIVNYFKTVGDFGSAKWHEAKNRRAWRDALYAHFPLEWGADLKDLSEAKCLSAIDEVDPFFRRYIASHSVIMEKDEVLDPHAAPLVFRTSMGVLGVDVKGREVWPFKYVREHALILDPANRIGAATLTGSGASGAVYAMNRDVLRPQRALRGKYCDWSSYEGILHVYGHNFASAESRGADGVLHNQQLLIEAMRHFAGSSRRVLMVPLISQGIFGGPRFGYTPQIFDEQLMKAVDSVFVQGGVGSGKYIFVCDYTDEYTLNYPPNTVEKLLRTGVLSEKMCSSVLQGAQSTLSPYHVMTMAALQAQYEYVTHPHAPTHQPHARLHRIEAELLDAELHGYTHDSPHGPDSPHRDGDDEGNPDMTDAEMVKKAIAEGVVKWGAYECVKPTSWHPATLSPVMSNLRAIETVKKKVWYEMKTLEIGGVPGTVGVTLSNSLSTAVVKWQSPGPEVLVKTVKVMGRGIKIKLRPGAEPTLGKKTYGSIMFLALGPDLMQATFWLKRRDGKGSCPPGGALNKGEDPLTAAVRETCEETDALAQNIFGACGVGDLIEMAGGCLYVLPVRGNVVLNHTTGESTDSGWARTPSGVWITSPTLTGVSIMSYDLVSFLPDGIMLQK